MNHHHIFFEKKKKKKGMGIKFSYPKKSEEEKQSSNIMRSQVMTTTTTNQSIEESKNNTRKREDDDETYPSIEEFVASYECKNKTKIEDEDDDETDTSIEDFLTNLYKSILNDDALNSYMDFQFMNMNGKNKLFNVIEEYDKMGTTFYSNFFKAYPEITIKRIGNIKQLEGLDYHPNPRIRLAIRNGKFNMTFTVWYKKEKEKK